MAKMLDLLGGGAVRRHLKPSKVFQKSEKFTKRLLAFSIAEALITLAIVGIALGSAAPLISKTMKHNVGTDIQIQLLQRQIEELKNEQKDSVVFFASNSCPPGWAKLTGFDGHYLRIQSSGETVGSVKEQMVHKHKHVSPYMTSNAYNTANYMRYGPFRVEMTDYGTAGILGLNQNAVGDRVYPKAQNLVNVSGAFVSGIYNLNNTNYAYSLYGLTSPGVFAYSWFTYTSDAVNRTESLVFTPDTVGLSTKDVTVCPNRDEGDAVCKPTGNPYGVPYLADMPLVGNENRPNSLVLTACVKGYKTCNMASGKLSCSN